MVLAGLALRLPRREAVAYVPMILALRAGLDYARRHPVIHLDYLERWRRSAGNYS